MVATLAEPEATLVQKQECLKSHDLYVASLNLAYLSRYFNVFN